MLRCVHGRIYYFVEFLFKSSVQGATIKCRLLYCLQRFGTLRSSGGLNIKGARYCYELTRTKLFVTRNALRVFVWTGVSLAFS
jgi:hypothetical protein